MGELSTASVQNQNLLGKAVTRLRDTNEATCVVGRLGYRPQHSRPENVLHDKYLELTFEFRRFKVDSFKRQLKPRSVAAILGRCSGYVSKLMLSGSMCFRSSDKLIEDSGRGAVIACLNCLLATFSHPPESSNLWTAGHCLGLEVFDIQTLRGLSAALRLGCSNRRH